MCDAFSQAAAQGLPEGALGVWDPNGCKLSTLLNIEQ
jgi:hypothetical protein